MSTSKQPATLDDAVFGKMEYMHSWHTKQNISWWGNTERSVKITAHAYTGHGITEEQRRAYAEYQQTIEKVVSETAEQLADFLSNAFDISCTKQALSRVLIPRTVLFLENGDWGVLFDSELEPEHGVALYKKGNDWKVGLQDDFL